MSEVKKALRLASVAKDLNVGTSTIIEHLQKKGYDIDNKPSVKLTEDMYNELLKEFQKDAAIKEKAEKIHLGHADREDVEIDRSKLMAPNKEEDVPEEVLIKSSTVKAPIEEPKKKTPEPKKEKPAAKKEKEAPVAKKATEGPKVVGKVDLDKVSGKKKPKVEEKVEEEVKPVEEEKKVEPVKEEAPKKEEKVEPEFRKTEKIQIDGPKIVGKIDLPVREERPKKEKEATGGGEGAENKRKRRRKRIVKPDRPATGPQQQRGRDDGGRGGDRKRGGKDSSDQPQVSEKEIQDKIKATMAKLSGGGSSKGKARAKLKRQRKEEEAEAREIELAAEKEGVLQVTEFISVSELASLMNVSATDVISKCMELGIIVSINQRLDAEVIELVGDEFGFKVKFTEVSDEDEDEIVEEDDPKDLEDRAPIVTVMGHVDHGKTSLLDYVRKANVVSGEAGGITQHIGAYEVTTDGGKRVVFLDTPGHEAFTAMRARGAKATDVVVIVIAADDSVMPQTKEAISHAQAAGVPMIFAINKMDKEGANPEKIKEQLANMNLLVEDWGGKYQCQEISAKAGTNVDKLLEKILLEAELLELKANPNKHALGTVVEASLDKGRGYVTTLLVQDGGLEIGDLVVSGVHYGRVKAMFNERGERLKKVGPSTAVQILGLNGAPQAGETFRSVDSDQEAKQITNKRQQILREQGLRTKKHITLDEIGRRLALGNFKELNIIIKGDVDGSIEALSDSLQKLSTQEIVVNVVHRAVGQITESDVLLASASDAIIIGFQVRPSVSARKLAEKENIEIRLYSIIYKAIEEITTAMEGMLEPTIEEEITGNIEVREVFKITRVGTVAGCVVVDGKIFRNSRIRIIRDGIVVHTGELASLKRFKDDVKEVVNGQDCGLNIKDFNDIKVGDVIEAYKETEVKRTL